MVSIPGVAEWTVATSGLNAGVFRGLREDVEIGCLLVFNDLSAFNAMVRSTEAVRDAFVRGGLQVHGDPALFERYLSLGRVSLDLRAGRAVGPGEKSRVNRRKAPP